MCTYQISKWHHFAVLINFRKPLTSRWANLRPKIKKPREIQKLSINSLNKYIGQLLCQELSDIFISHRSVAIRQRY